MKSLVNKKLNDWKLTKKLGAGACSDVYLVQNEKKNVGESYAMKVSSVPNVVAGKKKKKTLEARNADALYWEHLMYNVSLNGIKGLCVLPQGAYGEDTVDGIKYRYLVLELLGKDLKTIVEEHGRVDERTVARVGLELLTCIQSIHDKGVLLVDIKPDNFMLDREETMVYCVDLGISERFMTARGMHKEMVMGTVVGTPTYLSLSCHQGQCASRKDDVEALLNVLLYMVRGNLPWENAKSDHEGAEMKRDTEISDLCQSYAKEWTTMLTQIRNCAFTAKPNYDALKKGLKSISGAFTINSTFKWGASEKKQRKQSIGVKTKRTDNSTTPRKSPRISSKKQVVSDIVVPMKAARVSKRATSKATDNTKPAVKSTKVKRAVKGPKKSTKASPVSKSSPENAKSRSSKNKARPSSLKKKKSPTKNAKINKSTVFDFEDSSGNENSPYKARYMQARPVSLRSGLRKNLAPTNYF